MKNIIKHLIPWFVGILALATIIALCSGCSTSSGGKETANPADDPTTEVGDLKEPTGNTEGTVEVIDTVGSETTEPTETVTESTTEEPETSTPTEVKPTEAKPTEPRPTETQPKPTETQPQPTETEHKHNYSTKSVKATCTSDGYTTYTCSCGDSYKDNYVTATGHNWGEWKVIASATTTTDGKSERKCNTCGKVETRTDPAVPLGHIHMYGLEIITEPTCTKQGEGRYYCECGASYSAVMDPQGHWYSVTTIAPTCSEKGYDLNTCKRCGDSYKAGYVPELPHNYSEKVTKPTCMDNGYSIYTCKVCSYSYRGNETPSTGHDYEETVTKPTCMEKGYTTYKCKNCNHSYKGNETNATGHEWGEWVTTKEPTTSTTGTAERKCSDCGKVETKTLDKLPESHKHSYTGKVTTEATCTKDGVKTYTCSCGDTYKETIKATGHDYKQSDSKNATCTADGYKKYTCSKCKDSYSETIKATGHKYSVSGSKSASCTADGYKTYKCSNCGDTYKETIKATGHDYKLTDSKAATCTTKGYKKYTCSKCNHSYSENIDATGHNYKQTDSKNPTCTADGYKSYKCSNCGHTYKETIKATGHNYKLTDSKTATCTADGYKKYTCSKCNHSYTETVKGEHSWKYEHTDEVGHYEGWYVCHCGGWEFNGADGNPGPSFADHAQSTGEAQNHSYYVDYRWVVDTPAKDLWKCSNCGATSTTKPQSVDCLPVESVSVYEGNGKKYAK